MTERENIRQNDVAVLIAGSEFTIYNLLPSVKEGTLSAPPLFNRCEITMMFQMGPIPLNLQMQLLGVGADVLESFEVCSDLVAVSEV